jgi:hypothetical protein
MSNPYLNSEIIKASNTEAFVVSTTCTPCKYPKYYFPKKKEKQEKEKRKLFARRLTVVSRFTPKIFNL